jgi:hypothetical protein
MKPEKELNAERERFQNWVNYFKVETWHSEEDANELAGMDESFVWSVVFNWDSSDAEILPGFHAIDDTTGFYVAQRPWGDDAWELGVCEAVTVTCPVCQGAGEDENGVSCLDCDGQGTKGDLVSLETGSNYLGNPFKLQ